MRIRKLSLVAAVTAALAFVGAAAGDSPNQKATSAQGACGKGTARAALQVSADGGSKEASAGVGAGDRQGKRAGFKGGKGRGKGGDFVGGRKGGGFKGGRGGFGGGLTVDQIVDRLMAFDKNKDGKITKDELPERMQGLIAKGDTNKDGALDKDEIRKMASTLGQDTFAGAFGGRRGAGAGFGGPKGRFGGGGPRGGPGAPQAALADLNLSGKTKEKAEAVLKTHQESVRKLLEMTRSDLLVKMKDVLSEQEFKTFKANLERRPNAGLIGTRAGAPADLEQRLDRLGKEIEALRRELRR
jgi:hypothetical protein